jgi:hypothetical protein
MDKIIIKCPDWKSDHTKHPIRCFIATNLFLIISSVAQALELKPFPGQQTNFLNSSGQNLSEQRIAKRKISHQIEQKTTSIIAQQPDRNNLAPISTDNKYLAPDLRKLDRSAHPHRFYIGPDIFYRSYNEIIAPNPGQSFEFGTLYGAQATYNYVKGNSIYAGADFRYGGGTTTYDGSDQAGNPSASTTSNQLLNIEGRLGYTFSSDRQERLLTSPFIGLGYHQWNRDIASTPGSIGLVEDYSWGYVGPGLRLDYQASPQLDIGLDAKLMLMFNGKIDAKIKNAAATSGSGELGNALQYAIELPITYHLSQDANSNVDLKLTPYYRSQNIDRGPRFGIGTGSAQEPASNTSVYGITLGTQFNF